MNLLTLPIEVIQIINNYLNYRSQISFRQTCQILRQHIHQTDLYVNDYYSHQLTLPIIQQYPHITKLNLYRNQELIDLNHLVSLKQLSICATNINQDCIKNLTKLRVLDISININYFDLSIFTNLRILSINGTCNINTDSLIKLKKLRIIHAIINPDIQRIKGQLICSMPHLIIIDQF